MSFKWTSLPLRWFRRTEFQTSLIMWTWWLVFYHNVVPSTLTMTAFKHPGGPLDLRFAFNFGASTRSHTYVQ